MFDDLTDVAYEIDNGLAWITIGVLYYLLLTMWIKKPAALKI